MTTFKEKAAVLEKLYSNATTSNLYALTEIDRNIMFLAVEVVRHRKPASVQNYTYARDLVSNIKNTDSEYNKEFVNWMENDIESFYQPAKIRIEFVEACANEQ